MFTHCTRRDESVTVPKRFKNRQPAIMRLLFVHERFGALGGAEANLLATATELAARGHAVGLLHGPGTGSEEVAWGRTFGMRDRFFLRDAGAIAAAAAAFAPDLIYLHKLSDPDQLAGLSATGVPVVRMVHDHDLYCLRGYKYNPLTRKVCTRAASGFCVFPCGGVVRRSSGVFPLQWVSYGRKQRELALNRRFARLVVASEYMKGELVRNGFAPAQIELHAPVPRPGEDRRQSNFGPRNRIVYAGQIIRGKGVDVLLESLALVREPFECIILGDGNHRAHCEKLSVRLGLANRVTFAGFVPQSELPQYYRDATLAVMSSLWPEPFGATGLEAMHCGLPVVAFDAGGIREWLLDGQNGFLVPWRDRAALAARMTSLLRDKDLARRLGAHGRQWVANHFGFDPYISGLEQLFQRLAPQPAGCAA